MNKLNEAAEHFYNEMLLKKPFVDKEIATFLFKEVMESNAAKEYWYAQFQSSQPKSQVPDDFEKITGHKTPEEMTAYEKGREHEEAVFMKFIKEWDGKTNSHFGQAMYNTFKRLNKSQVSDEEDLTFNALRNANKLRLPQFKNSKGEPAHEKADGSDWSLAEWMNAVAGELGEAANIIKKIRRGDMTLIEAKEMLAEEFADIVTYLDITAYQAGINLGEATKNKFNKVSERVGSNIRL